MSESSEVVFLERALIFPSLRALPCYFEEHHSVTQSSVVQILIFGLLLLVTGQLFQRDITKKDLD